MSWPPKTGAVFIAYILKIRPGLRSFGNRILTKNLHVEEDSIILITYSSNNKLLLHILRCIEARNDAWEIATLTSQIYNVKLIDSYVAM